MISFRMRLAISARLPSSLAFSASNQTAASLMDRAEMSAIVVPSSLTAKASGFNRAPPQALQGVVPWYFSISSRTQALSVSRQRRSMFGMTPSKLLRVL